MFSLDNTCKANEGIGILFNSRAKRYGMVLQEKSNSQSSSAALGTEDGGRVWEIGALEHW